MGHRNLCVVLLFGFVLPSVLCQHDSMFRRTRERPPTRSFSRLPSNGSPDNQGFDGSSSPRLRSSVNRASRRPTNQQSREAPKRRPEIIIEFRNNNRRQSNQVRTSNSRTFDSPKSNSRSLDDPRINQRSFDGPSNNRRSFDGRSNNQRSFDGPSNNQRSFDSSSNNRRSFDEPSNNQRSFDGPSNNQRSFDSPSNNRRSFDGPSNNQRSFDGQSNNRRSFDGPSNNQRSFDSPSNNRRSFDGPSNNQRSFDGPSNNHRSFDGPSNNQRSFDSPNNNRRSFDSPGSKSERIPSFNSISSRDRFQNDWNTRQQDHANNVDFGGPQDNGNLLENSHFTDASSRRNNRKFGSNSLANDMSSSSNSEFPDRHGSKSNQPQFDGPQTSRGGPLRSGNNIEQFGHGSGHHMDSRGNTNFGNDNRINNQLSQGHSGSGIHGQPRHGNNNNHHGNNIASNNFDNINTGNKPVDINLNSEVLGSVNTGSPQVGNQISVFGNSGHHGNTNHHSNNVNSMISAGQSSSAINIGHLSQHGNVNLNGFPSPGNPHSGQGHSTVDNNMINQIGSIMSVPLNQINQPTGQQTNVLNQQPGIGHQATLGQQLGAQTLGPNNAAAMKIGNNLIHLSGQAGLSQNNGPHGAGSNSHGPLGPGGSSLGLHGPVGGNRSSHGPGGPLGVHGGPLLDIGGPLPIDINNTIETLTNLIASNVSPGLQALSGGNGSTGPSKHPGKGNHGGPGPGPGNMPPRHMIEPIEVDYEEILQRAMTNRILGGLNMRG